MATAAGGAPPQLLALTILVILSAAGIALLVLARGRVARGIGVGLLAAVVARIVMAVGLLA